MKLSLTKKLYGAAGVLLAVLVVVSALSYFSQRSLLKGYQALAEQDGAQMEASMEAINQLGLSVEAYKNYLIRGDDKYAQQFRESVKTIGEALAKYETLVDSEEERTVYTNGKTAFDGY